MKLVCATLLAFMLVTPAAHAWPPKKPRDTTPPTVPTGLRVVSVTEDSVTVRWNASTDNSGKILRYVVNGLFHSGTSTEKTLEGLVPGYTLDVRVKAVDPSENESALSAPLSVTTAPDVTPPTTPGNLRATATTPSSVSLAWDRSTDRWGFGYQVLMDGEVVLGAGGTGARVRHIPPGTHVFAVRARDAAGNVSGLSNALTLTFADTGDRVAPSAPANLTAVDLDDFCGSVRLFWGASSDDVDPPSTLEYELFRNGFLWELITGFSGSAFTYGLNGTNTFTVVAVDRAGNSSPPSNPVTLNLVTDETLC
jgi:chitodextrinase